MSSFHYIVFFNCIAEQYDLEFILVEYWKIPKKRLISLLMFSYVFIFYLHNFGNYSFILFASHLQ